MKKILILTFGILLSSLSINAKQQDIPPDSLTAATVYNDIKSLYKDDLKDVVKYSVNKADTLLTKGYRVLSKGAAHTYDILRYQQFVKSLHHLFYWLAGLSLTILLIYRIKLYVNNKDEFSLTYIIILFIISVSLDVYNASTMNEMLTGFINPEYGAIKEIIETLQ
jgi:hypothetical protein